MRGFRLSCLALSLGLAAVLSGCGSSTTTTAVPPPNPTITLAPVTAAVLAGQTTQFTATTNVAASSLLWEVNGIAGGNSTVGTISSSGLYTAPGGAGAQAVTVSVLDTAMAAVMATAQEFVVGAGAVSATANGQVAAYTINLPSSGTAEVNFGPTTAYIRNTWQVNSPTGGGATTVLVAGMNVTSMYHMQAVVTLANGLSVTDADHTFTTTQSVPAANLPSLVNAGAATGFTPQPGVELLTDLYHGADVYDLNGNLIWAYDPPDMTSSDQVYPAEMLGNGNMILLVAAGSDLPLFPTSIVPGTVYEIREIDLANNLIDSVSLAQLNANLQATGYKNNQNVTPTLQDIHHEVTVNPVTGHLLLVASTLETISGLTGFTNPVTVLGDMVLDVDPTNNFAVTWVWNEFDHLDVNRHPFEFPDWTHTNAVAYSASDHNILVSSRHQSWVMKIDYNDGHATDGAVLWRLGYQGDFQLLNEDGTQDNNPQDWMYAQHEPAFTTANTTGVFGLTLMDNGTYRNFTAGYPCGTAGNLPCYYSRTPIFTLDDTQMTAKLSNAYIGPEYSFFGGNAEVLPNGNEHADYCATPGGSVITEFTVGAAPQLVWAMQIVSPNNSVLMYRGHRIGSLYPGVTWAQ
jgi:arylsulfate sulfotransferase